MGKREVIFTLKNIEALRKTILPLLEPKIKVLTEKAIEYHIENEPQLKNG